MEASCWERLSVGETGPCSDVQALRLAVHEWEGLAMDKTKSCSGGQGYAQ